MKLKAAGKTIPVTDFAEASRVYSDMRDASGLGASRFRDGKIVEGRKTIGRVSYNGRVWRPGEWRQGEQPLYDNRA